MKAAVHTRYGPPEVVRVMEVPRPTTGSDDLLVNVHATTVNRTDCAYRAAKPLFVRSMTGWRTPRRTVLGTEFAGIVAAVGSAVTSYSTGDRVFGYCEGRFGAHAEFVLVRHDGMLASMPTNLSFEEAAPGTEGAHYAMAFLTRAQIRAGQAVLVNGATGAIGSAAVQLLNNLGTTVTAVCHGEQMDLVTRLGADRVIDCDSVDFTAGTDRYDVIIDAVGTSTFGRCRSLLTDRGIYSSADLGPYWQNLPLAVASPLLRGRKVVFPLPWESPELAVHLRDLMQSGAFTPVIDRRYPLDDIVEAYRYVESGEKIGNVVITMPGPA